ncbi:MAG: hypothetical protein EZS28_006967 [Streblomastix strix]|uniref:Uncharacterized protein n=1 Tax=Streblomastix strix TaxID=222440 RepID=A0A5J4WSL6_9EUKA|nr:MAG: hypothetical protein EZS28_006967 [Streblomastix strix]
MNLPKLSSQSDSQKIDQVLPFLSGIVVASGNVILESALETTPQSVISSVENHVLPAMFSIQHAVWQAHNLDIDSPKPTHCTVVLVGSTSCEIGEMDSAPYTIAKHALLGLFRSSCADLFGLDNRVGITEDGQAPPCRIPKIKLLQFNSEIQDDKKCNKDQHGKDKEQTFEIISPYLLKTRLSGTPNKQFNNELLNQSQVSFEYEGSNEQQDDEYEEHEALQASYVAQHIVELLDTLWGPSPGRIANVKAIQK